MQDPLTASKNVRRALESVVRDIVKQETKDCFRLRKAILTQAPGYGDPTCGVCFVGETQTLNLPYSSKINGVADGSTVWVAIIYGSMRNAIVWETGDFQ